MIYRLMYYSQLRIGVKAAFCSEVTKESASILAEWKGIGLSEVSVFVLDQFVCVYAETEDPTIIWDWPEAFGPWLETWPTEPNHYIKQKAYRLSVPMIDVFHDGVPLDTASWRGQRLAEERIGSIIRLKPDQVSSYIYYHYQMQEETPEFFNKTYLIGIFGRILFSYYELPATISDTKLQGLLSTNQRPTNWDEVMKPHFQLTKAEEEANQLWSQMERIL